MKRTLLLASVSLLLAGCAELHHRDGKFKATGVSANILFFQIPKDPFELANAKVPSGATVTNVNGSMNSWKTVPGFINRLLGIGWAQVGGTASSTTP